ncbi:MAG: type II secretion system F family protein [Holosporales bacterium]|nr:type II secretion system F family protein [Holosporales bacterium]
MRGTAGLFCCKILDAAGDIKIELVFADSEANLRDRMRRSGASIIHLKPYRSRLHNHSEAFTLPFLKSLLQLVENHLELVTSIDITSQLFSDLESRAICVAIMNNIKNGKSLSKAVADFPNYFNVLAVKIIEVAERTARLPEALRSIISYVSMTVSIRKRLKTAATYPLILLGFAAMIVIFWLLVVVPRFAEMFAETGMELPFLTSCVLSISSFCINHTFILIGILILVISSGVFIIKSKHIRKRIVKLLPIINNIRREFLVMNFFYGISIMLQEKINLLDAIRSIANVGDDIDTGKLEKLIQNGNSLANSMRSCKIFEDYEVSIIETGEKAGDLWSAFRSVSDMMRLHLQQKLEKIINLLQPLTIILIGLILILIVCSIVLPMYSVIDLGI